MLVRAAAQMLRRAALTALAASAAPFSSTSASAATPLAFVAEQHYIASPEKANKLGEDALVSSRYILGVADGVGGWIEENVDSGLYSRALLGAAKDHCDAAIANGDEPDLAAALVAAHRSVRLAGSSTACLALAGRSGRLRLVNLGDSGLQVWHRARPASLLPSAPLRLAEAQKLWQLRYSAPKQLRKFNFPLQLAADRRATDLVSDGVDADVAVQLGDLVIVGTDGLWDNLGVSDVRAVLARFDLESCTRLARMSRLRYAEALKAEDALAAPDADAAGPPPPKSLERLKLLSLADEAAPSNSSFAAKEAECRAQLKAVASMLAYEAIRIGGDENSRGTPFESEARRAGFRFEGGKLDDTAVVVALIVADEQTFDVFC